MNEIFKFFVENWRFSLLVTILTIVVGTMSLNMLRKESFPPVNFAIVTITTIYPGASPEEVQDKVTKEIESELRGIEGLKRVKSTSQSEISTIVIEIDIDSKNTKDIVTDIQKGVQRASAQLPQEILEDPRITEVKAEEIPVYEFALIGPNENRARDILAEKIEDQFDDIPGVLDTRTSGLAAKELQILIDPSKLKEHRLSISEIIQELSLQLKNTPSGFIDNQKEISLVRVVGKKKEPQEIADLTIRASLSGPAIKIRDVAEVRYGTDRPKILSRLNGEEATLFVVTKKSSTDTITLVTEINKQMSLLKKELKAPYSIHIYNNEGARVENRLEIVKFNAVSGIIIVLLVLFLFLPGKIGLFSALSLPICALGTVAFMIYFGAQFNIITMIALVICLGNLVDNSVVISEYYTQLREQGGDAKSSATKAANQFWIPFTASTITIICAFLPMLVTKGVMGQFIRWIPIIVTIALILSLIESVTLLPARLQFLHPRKKAEHNGSQWFIKFETFFAKIIKLTLDFKWLTVGSLFGLIIAGFLVNGLFNRFELFPPEGVEYYVARFELKNETSIFQTDQLGKLLSQQIKDKIPAAALQGITTRVGISQTDLSDPKTLTGEQVGISIIAIQPEWSPVLDIEKTLRDLRSIQKLEGMTKLTFEPIEAGPPVGRPLTLTFRSTQVEQLSQLAHIILAEVKKIGGVIDPDLDEQSTGSEYQFIPDSNKLAYSGISNDLLSLNLTTAIQGTTLATFNDQGRKFDVVAQFAAPFTTDVEFVKNVEILNKYQLYIPVNKLGDFHFRPSPKTQKNFNYQRSITLTADVDTSKISALDLNAKVRKILFEKAVSYPEVNFVFGGEEESTNESLQSLGLALVIAIFGIFATLVFTFKSFLKPLIILTTIPLGLVGVLFAFTVGQRPLSFLAFIGIVGLSGVVINSAIILVDYIEELIRDRLDLNLKEILILASKQRLRAVMATGLTTVVGLLPTAFGLGGYDAILVPITLALSWGMMIGTILTLIWVPSIYLIIYKNHRRD